MRGYPAPLRTMAVGSLLFGLACSKAQGRPGWKTPEPEPTSGAAAARAPVADRPCAGGKPMTVHFYDVGQGLAALVDLPDGRHLLVDAGDSPHRRGCDMCGVEDEHLLRRLSIDLHEAPIDLLWVTHQHSDHVGGAAEVMGAFKVGTYVDNGRDLSKADVKLAHQALADHGVAVRVVDPDHRDPPPLEDKDVKLRSVLPAVWPLACDRNPDECSIGLRIDYCASSVLFMGDAERDEEAVLDPHGEATLLQVADHGSDTSTTSSFLAQVRPKYAVISAGRPGDAANRKECAPSATLIQRLTQALGGENPTPLKGFAGDRCDRARAADWVEVPASERLWATERDGDVVLVTKGDGTFSRKP